MMNKPHPVAIVTGGSQGIGLAITRALIVQKYRVIIADLHQADANNLATLDVDSCPSVCFKTCDVSDPAQIKCMINEITQEFGTVDVLVNNAGIVSRGALTEIGDGEWRRVFNINVEGPFMLTKAVLPGMMEQKWGRIINIASVASQTGGGFLGNTCYAASKGAILSLSKGIAREYAGSCITCNAICPGFVATPLTASMPQSQVEVSLTAIPAGRPAIPEEIADAVVFLAGEQSRYINGITLNVDGGLIRY